MSGSKIDLEQLLRDGQLPALPQSAIRILELSKDPDNGPVEYARQIECDPGLASQVLKFVNSSYFGFAREIANVKQAIMLVGTRTVKNFTLWSAVFSLLPNPKCGAFDLKLLWQDSLRRGLFARRMGKILGLRDAEDAFAAALLQDMAVPLLAKQWPEHYNELLAVRAASESRLSELERERFGFDHAQAAARFARTWNLPEELAVPLELHTQTESLDAPIPAKATQQAVALSALLPASCDSNWHDAAVFDRHFVALKGANPATAAAVLAEVDAEFAEFAPVLKISVPAQTLVSLFREAAVGV